MRAAVANQHCTMLPLLNQGVDVHSRDSVHSRCRAARSLPCAGAARSPGCVAVALDSYPTPFLNLNLVKRHASDNYC